MGIFKRTAQSYLILHMQMQHVPTRHALRFNHNVLFKLKEFPCPGGSLCQHTGSTQTCTSCIAGTSHLGGPRVGLGRLIKAGKGERILAMLPPPIPPLPSFDLSSSQPIPPTSCLLPCQFTCAGAHQEATGAWTQLFASCDSCQATLHGILPQPERILHCQNSSSDHTRSCWDWAVPHMAFLW